MNSIAQFENRTGSRRSQHEGESSTALCDRLSRTRDSSQRQLPTDQDYAVSTREYQTDQSSLKAAPAAAGSVLEKRQKQRQRQKQHHDCAGVDRSLHIRAEPELRVQAKDLEGGFFLGKKPLRRLAIGYSYSGSAVVAHDRFMCGNQPGLAKDCRMSRNYCPRRVFGRGGSPDGQLHFSALPPKPAPPVPGSAAFFGAPSVLCGWR